jgi:hypothetical protein
MHHRPAIALILLAALQTHAPAGATMTDADAGNLIRIANERIAAGDTPADVEAWLTSHMQAGLPAAAATSAQPWDVYAGNAAAATTSSVPIDVWQRSADAVPSR